MIIISSAVDYKFLLTLCTYYTMRWRIARGKLYEFHKRNLWNMTCVASPSRFFSMTYNFIKTGNEERRPEYRHWKKAKKLCEDPAKQPLKNLILYIGGHATHCPEWNHLRSLYIVITISRLVTRTAGRNIDTKKIYFFSAKPDILASEKSCI